MGFIYIVDVRVETLNTYMLKMKRPHLFKVNFVNSIDSIYKFIRVAS